MSIKSYLGATVLGVSLTAGCTVETQDNDEPQMQQSCGRIDPVIVQRICRTVDPATKKAVASTPLLTESSVANYCEQNRNATLRCLQSNTDLYMESCVGSQAEVNANVDSIIHLDDAVGYKTSCSDPSVASVIDHVFRRATNPELSSCYGMTQDVGNIDISCDTTVRPR